MPKQRIPVKPATDLEKELGYEFKDKELLRRALTHSSAINENHPQASNRDLSSLAFVGDAVLKYAVARCLFRHGHDHVTMKPRELHKAAVANIKNSVLAAIGNKKLHLGEYLVRGNAPTNPTENMYADCMEAILGAIALDCGNDQQHSIFNVIETLCSENIEKWLKDIQQEKFVANCFRPEAEWITEDIPDWPNVQLQAALYHSRMASPSPERSYLQRLEERYLWVFAGFGFVLFFYMRNFRK